MKATVIVNGRLITLSEVIDDAIVVIDGDRITACGKKEKVAVPDKAQIVDATGLYVAPGMIDIHNHGGKGFWFQENPEEALAVHVLKGTTGVLGTPSFSMMSPDEVEEFVKHIRKIRDTPMGAALIGLFLEGRPTNPKCGATPKDKPKETGLDDYLYWLKLAGDIIKLWMLAPDMASYNPAKLLGLDKDVGSIETGKKANLFLATDRMEVRQVFLEGVPL